VLEVVATASGSSGVLVLALVGGRWAAESPYLAFIVGLATTFALIVFYRRDRARTVGGLLGSLWAHRVAASEARLGWLLVLATMPVGVTGPARRPGCRPGHPGP